MEITQVNTLKNNTASEVCQVYNSSVRSFSNILGNQSEEIDKEVSSENTNVKTKYQQSEIFQPESKDSILDIFIRVTKLNIVFGRKNSMKLNSSFQKQEKPNSIQSKRQLSLENDESQNLDEILRGNQSTYPINLDHTDEYDNQQNSKECFIKELFFLHIIKQIQKINKEINQKQCSLKLKNLPPISEKNKLESYIHLYQNIVTQLIEKKKKINFYKLFFWQLDSNFTILMLILGIVESNSNFLISLLLNYLVEDFQNNNLTQSYFICLTLFFISMIGILSRHYQYTQLSKHGGKIKQIITYILMRKLNQINHSSIQQSKSCSILNLISSDLSSLESQYGYIYCIPIIPMSLIFSGWILWDKFQGAYGLIALLICILTYPTQTLIQKSIQQKIKNLKEFQDFRIKQQNNYFENIQTIKMYCWQDQLEQRIQNTRCKEWKQYIFIQFFTLIDRSINQSINIWGSFLFLIIVYNLNVNLTLQNVILTIQLMGSIRYYCVHQVSYGLKAIITLNVIFKRILDFLKIQPLFVQQIQQQSYHQENNQIQQENDIENDKVMNQLTQISSSTNIQTKLSMSIIEDEQIQIRQLNCFWNQNKAPILKNINFNAHRGQLTCLIGKTGSGKTTFLQLLLKEVPYVSGILDISDNFSFGYVEQEPFITPTTIKDNILFGKQFDQELFNEVIKASNIQQDIQQMPDLENTVVGDNGTLLSGGQKVRLSLARALYSMPDIYLFDDPLSAVDSKVAKHIFTQAIKKFIFQYQTQKQNYLPPIVIMTTHQLQYALKCDYIIVLEEGQIICQGKSSIISNQIGQILNVQPADLNENPTTLIKQEKNNSISQLNQKQKRKQSLEIDQLTHKNIRKTVAQLLEYFSFSRIGLILLFNFITEIIRNLFYHYLTFFVDSEGIQKYGSIIIILVISNSLNNIIKYALCSHAILTTNNKIFSKTMTILGKSKKENFEKIPSSVILNKFSTDFSIIDSQMALILIDIFEDGTQFFFSLLTLGYFQPYFFLPILISIFLSNILLRNFSNVLSQLKLNDLAQRAPQLQFLKTNLKGLTHFRLMNYFEIQKKYIYSLANNSFQSNYFYHQTQKCFSQCIDLIALLTKTSGMLLMIAFISDSSLFSQALLLLQSFHSQNTLLRQLMELGGVLNSYQRLFEITDIEIEQEIITKNILPQAWPKLGNIKFIDLSLSYSKNQALVLKQMNLEIKEREKVAFIGRTGAGKSSIINALFRLTEIHDESQIQIDGQNVNQLSLSQLRKTFSIIPQQPFIFYGSIRENLDPENSFPDRDIWNALSEVKMDKFFECQPLKLDTNVLELNLSAGQKQLICLARVILMRSKILILDEPSANVDIITDNQIQEIIREKFMHCTVITIAHRLNTISFYDKVIVLDNGQIIESGNPFELLCDDVEGNNISKQSKFAEMIQETGKKNAQQFFQISKEYYKINQIKQKLKTLI